MKYSHLATRLFGVPLLIERGKLDVILSAIGDRVGVEVEAPEAYGPGDSGKSRKDYYVTEDGIGVIDIVGPLVKRNSGAFLSGGPTTYGQIEQEFTDAATDPNIKGILLQIDSPGGETTGCWELADLIYSQRGSKPIIAAADGDAFSAAYALASSADTLFVARSGGVGSVGVWMMHVDQSAYNEAEGFKPTFIFAGAHKIDGNPHEPLSDQARQTFQNIVDGSYQIFVDTVARNRGMSADAVRKTEAGLYWGQPKRGNPGAVEIGFADKVGTVADAMAELRRRISAQSSSVAKLSATRGGKTKMNTEAVADTQNPPEPATAAPAGGETLTITIHSFTDQELAEHDSAARLAGADHAKQIFQLCALAGLTARQALTFLKPDASIDAVRQELLDARAANGGDEISGHILPEAGAMAKTKTEDSPLVKLAEARAAAQGGK